MGRKKDLLELSKDTCPSCGEPFIGKHCYACGEKKISRKDFALSKYARQAFDHFTHLDTKVFRSFRFLIFKPGFLSLEFVKGRRVLYVKPLQVFVFINLIFFFFLGSSDIFSPRLQWIYASEKMFIGNASVKAITDAKAAELSMTVEAFIPYFDEKIGKYTKAALYLFIPVLALVLHGLYFRQYRHYLCHLIFATHWFAYVLLFFIVAAPAIQYMGLKAGPLLTSIALCLMPHLFLSLKLFYRQHAWLSALKTLVVCLSFVFFLVVYRELMLWTTFQLL